MATFFVHDSLQRWADLENKMVPQIDRVEQAIKLLLQTSNDYGHQHSDGIHSQSLYIEPCVIPQRNQRDHEKDLGQKQFSCKIDRSANSSSQPVNGEPNAWQFKLSTD